MKTRTKILLTAAAAAGAVGGAWALTRKENQKKQHIDSEQGIELKEFRQINGIPQYLVHRSENIQNPVMLVLHGGPGESAIPTSYLYQRGWERYFTVVNWDQRLCGQTLKANQHRQQELLDTICTEQLVEDVREICLYLTEKYGCEKVILLGHSWGSVLGSLFIRKYPQLVEAYVGVGQVISMIRNEEVGYEKALQAARIAGDSKDVRTLQQLQPYPQPQMDEAMMKKMLTLRRIQRKYHLASSASLRRIWQLLTTPDLPAQDLPRYFDAGLQRQHRLLQELMDFDLRKLDPKVEVPIYFLLGDQDWQTPYPVAQEYFKQIAAPRKQLILIPNAGHGTMLDQPEMFLHALRSVLQR